MKASTLFFAALLIGGAHWAGQGALHSFPPRASGQDPCSREAARTHRSAFSRSSAIQTREIRSLKEKEEELSGQIREAEVALDRIAETRREVRNRFENLAAVGSSLPRLGAEKEIENLGYAEAAEALAMHLHALDGEEQAFEILLERLKVRQASLAAAAEIEAVRTTRSTLEAFASTAGEEDGPLSRLRGRR